MTAPVVAPALTASSLCAPVQGAGGRELAGLEVPGAPVAARLRAAWIYLQTDRPRRGLECIDQVLYAPEAPSPAEEAFARYIRGESYRALGDDLRADFELERARELALDTELKRRLEAEKPKAEPEPAAGAGLAVRGRPAWNAIPEIRRRLEPMGKAYRITIHHSAMYFRDMSERASAAAIRRIQKEHVDGRGYGDIGYHLVVDPAGRVWVGRDTRWQGAHARGVNNRGNIGICMLGNFVRGAQTPSPQQVRVLRQLLAKLTADHGIPPEQIKTHRDFVNTQCPGERLQVVVNQLRLEFRGAAVVAGR